MTRRTAMRSATVVGVALTALSLSAATAIAAGPERPAEYYEQRSAEIKEYVEEHVTEAVPQAEAVVVGTPTTDTGGFYDGQGYLFHFVAFEDGIGQTALALQYDEPGHFGTTPERLCEEDGAETCTVEERSDGSTLVTSTVPVSDQQEILRVTHFRTDGSVTWGCGYNYDPIFDGDEGPIREDFSVTDEQLTQLVTDPELTL
ncbi:hypothetical protein [Streptomyces sp. 6N223]|uniref:hypothetical protein n=1 Tax=Streptomyces sp. 6N223 TaxID=3457412 RepID=UPI003FD06DE1